MILRRWFASLGLDWLVPRYPESRVCLDAITSLNPNTFNIVRLCSQQELYHLPIIKYSNQIHEYHS